MPTATLFRALFILFALAMVAIRLYTQRQVLPERQRTRVTGSVEGGASR